MELICIDLDPVISTQKKTKEEKINGKKKTRKKDDERGEKNRNSRPKSRGCHTGEWRMCVVGCNRAIRRTIASSSSSSSPSLVQDQLDLNVWRRDGEEEEEEERERETLVDDEWLFGL